MYRNTLLTPTTGKDDWSSESWSAQTYEREDARCGFHETPLAKESLHSLYAWREREEEEERKRGKGEERRRREERGRGEEVKGREGEERREIIAAHCQGMLSHYFTHLVVLYKGCQQQPRSYH